MATIDEIILAQPENWLPGSLKVHATRSYDNGSFFVPYFKAKRLWYGLNHVGNISNFDEKYTEWEIHHEPTPKVTRWLWTTVRGTWVSDGFYAEKPFDERHDFVKKLLWSETEFDA